MACRQLGFAGGAAYNPPKNFSSPLLMDNIQCVGSEENLLKCAFSKWYVGTGCSYYSERAGVLCYNDTGIITLIIHSTSKQVLYFDLMIACLQIQIFATMRLKTIKLEISKCVLPGNATITGCKPNHYIMRKMSRTRPQIRVCTGKLFSYFSTKTYVVGT